MSARTLTLPAIVLVSRHAGTWLVHGLWLAFNLGAACLDSPAHMPRLVLSSIGIAFWWMLMSGHLLGTVWQMHRMLLPRTWRTLATLLLPAWALTVLLPALAWAWLDQASLLSGVWVLTVVALATMLLTSVPPIVMAALIPLGFALKLAAHIGIEQPPWTDASALVTPLVLAGLTALCWWPMFRHGAPASQWLRPIAIALLTSTGTFSLDQMRQQQAIGWLGGNVHPDLMLPVQKRARAILGVALGPAIGKPRLRALLLGHLWLVALAGLWLIAPLSGQAGTGDRRFLLFLPSIMVAVVSVSALMRLWTLFRKPELGLYELALLPGQATGAGRAHDLARLLLERMGISTAIACAVMAVFGVVLQAPVVYFAMLLGTGLACLLVNATLSLWCSVRGGLHGMLLGWVIGLEAALVLLANHHAIARGQVPGWMLLAWTALLLAAGGALARLTRRLGLRQQPWQARAGRPLPRQASTPC